MFRKKKDKKPQKRLYKVVVTLTRDGGYPEIIEVHVPEGHKFVEGWAQSDRLVDEHGNIVRSFHWGGVGTRSYEYLYEDVGEEIEETVVQRRTLRDES